MIVKTRKYALPKKRYILLAFIGFLYKQGLWMLPIYLALNTGLFLWSSWWWLIGSTILLILYLLFWLIQFAGITQLEQFKVFFQKLSYEIDTKQILIKLNVKEGMPVPWSKVKSARMRSDGFIFHLSVAQIIYLPFKIFHSQHEIKVVETLLRRRNYLERKTIPFI